jgi:excisionase family DNA binding protein
MKDLAKVKEEKKNKKKKKKDYRRKEFFRNIFEDLWLYDTQLSLSECAAYLDKTQRTVVMAIKNKEITATRIGKSFVIPKLQFLTYPKKKK